MSASRRFDNTCKYKNLEVANGYNDIQYNSVRCKNVTDATLRPHKRKNTFYRPRKNVVALESKSK